MEGNRFNGPLTDGSAAADDDLELIDIVEVRVDERIRIRPLDHKALRTLIDGAPRAEIIVAPAGSALAFIFDYLGIVGGDSSHGCSLLNCVPAIAAILIELSVFH